MSSDVYLLLQLLQLPPPLFAGRGHGSEAHQSAVEFVPSAAVGNWFPTR